MGLRTHMWGPVYWSLLHCIAHYLDQFASTIQLEWWRLLEDILPCKHCRTCAAAFCLEYKVTDDHARKHARFIYDLHTHVNLKLFKQDIVCLGLYPNTREQSTMYEKWFGYQPSFPIMVMTMNTGEFIDTLFACLFYAVYDIRTDTAQRRPTRYRSTRTFARIVARLAGSSCRGLLDLGDIIISDADLYRINRTACAYLGFEEPVTAGLRAIMCTRADTEITKVG